MWKEFKAFALTGNLVDIAVAFVMGGAFGKVVTTFTGGFVAPIIGLFMGGVNLNELHYVLKVGSPEVKDATGAVTTPAVAEVAIKYGEFLTNCIDFIVVAFIMFLIIKGIQKAKRKEAEAPAAPAAPAADIALLTEIRDLLKK